MLDAAPSGLLRVNKGVDTNRLDGLLTFMSNAILKSGLQTFKIHTSGWNERAEELNALYREAVSHWKIAGAPEVVHLQS